VLLKINKQSVKDYGTKDVSEILQAMHTNTSDLAPSRIKAWTCSFSITWNAS